jgi:hypothetical protein
MIVSPTEEGRKGRLVHERVRRGSCWGRWLRRAKRITGAGHYYWRISRLSHLEVRERISTTCGWRSLQGWLFTEWVARRRGRSSKVIVRIMEVVVRVEVSARRGSGRSSTVGGRRDRVTRRDWRRG